MPGSSLWLLPPPSHPLSAILPTLISQVSEHFRSPHRFLPHVTLTSEIPASSYGSDPQAWLDALELPSTSVQVKFVELSSEAVFVRKLYIKCAKGDGLKELAKFCRQKVEGYREDDKAAEWADKRYNPHLSLLYHDCPVFDEPSLSKVEDMALKLEVDVHGAGNLGGWEGGSVVLVPTDKTIDQWSAIAERKL